MSDWDAFREASGFAKLYEPVSVQLLDSPLVLSGEFEHTYPILGELLRAARISEVETVKGRRRLIAWTGRTGTPIGWLSYPPGQQNRFRFNRYC